MVGGYNTNVPYKGITYHVQTEDGGRRNPVIISRLYDKGVVVATETRPYADILIDDDYEVGVKARMKELHKMVVKNLLSGNYTEPKPEPEAFVPPKPRTIDDMIMDYLIAPEG